MNEIFVQYKGFSPSTYTRSYFTNMLRQLHEESPTTSVMKAHMSRSGGMFKGMVKITSAAGDFFAIASGSRIKDVGHRLTLQIRKQLEKWKANRFSHEKLSETEPHYKYDLVKNYDSHSIEDTFDEVI